MFIQYPPAVKGQEGSGQILRPLHHIRVVFQKLVLTAVIEASVLLPVSLVGEVSGFNGQQISTDHGRAKACCVMHVMHATYAHAT